MSDQNESESLDDQLDTRAALAAAVTSNYKVLGQLTASSGVGVLGQKDASSGRPIGVKGVVPNNPDGWGLETPHDAQVGGDLDSPNSLTLTVDEVPTLRLGPTGERTGGYDIGGNVIAGYEGNTAFGVDGATISGGGNEYSSNENRVTDNYGTVGGGRGNQAGDATSGTENAVYATVSGGGAANTAAGLGAAIGGGDSNTAEGRRQTIAGGVSNTAKGTNPTVGGGYYNTASGSRSTVGGGQDNSATNWYATVPGGKNNTAAGFYSFAGGRRAKANDTGSFVWADSTDADFASSIADQFLIEAGGGVGIGTTSTPHDRVTIRGTNANTVGEWGNHLVGMETMSADGDVLALRNAGQANPGGSTNFLTFFDDSTTDTLGAVQGDGSGGVNYKSGNFDIAEYFPKADPDAAFDPGDVVGLDAGAVVGDAADADAALVVSRSPMVTGNVPAPDRESEFVCLALLGQVPVHVARAVEPGTVLRAGPEGQAVPIDTEAVDDPKVVGLALEAGDEEVLTLVGGPGVSTSPLRTGDGSTAGRGASHETGTDPHGDSASASRPGGDRVAALEAENEALSTQNEALDRENEALRERISAVERTLDTLQARVGDLEGGSPATAPADD